MTPSPAPRDAAATPDEARVRRVTLALWVLTLLAVTYGSLYPLQFVRPASLRAAWHHMLFEAGWWQGGGDVLANVVLFVPVGALSWLLLQRRAMPGRTRFALLLVGGFLFAFVLQVLQLWLPRRWPQLSDAVWNALGLGIGVGLAPMLRAPLERLAGIGDSPQRAGLAIGALWLVLAWWPLVPVLNRHQLHWAWYQIQRSSEFAPAGVLAPALAAAIVLHLLRPAAWRGAAALLGPALALAGLFVFSLHPAPPGQLPGWLLGATLGALGWTLPRRTADALMVLGAGGALVAQGLLPWQWSVAASPWTWVPLHDALAGQRVARTLALGWQLFWCAAVTIGARRLGLRPGTTAAALVGLLLALEIAQRWMPAQRAEVTPLLLPLLCLAGLRVLVPGRRVR